MLAVGLACNAAPVPESPGRWVANPRQAVVKESEWILTYDALQPRVGDRIPNELFVALAEKENRWARDYFVRQREALLRAASRLPETDRTAARVVAADEAVLDHNQTLVVGVGERAIDPFSLGRDDSLGTHQRARAAALVRTLQPADYRSWEHRDGVLPRSFLWQRLALFIGVPVAR